MKLLAQVSQNREVISGGPRTYLHTYAFCSGSVSRSRHALSCSCGYKTPLQGETYHQERHDVVGAAIMGGRCHRPTNLMIYATLPFLSTSRKQKRHKLEHASSTIMEEWERGGAGHRVASHSLVMMADACVIVCWWRLSSRETEAETGRVSLPLKRRLGNSHIRLPCRHVVLSSEALPKGPVKFSPTARHRPHLDYHWTDKDMDRVGII